MNGFIYAILDSGTPIQDSFTPADDDVVEGEDDETVDDEEPAGDTVEEEEEVVAEEVRRILEETETEVPAGEVDPEDDPADGEDVEEEENSVVSIYDFEESGAKRLAVTLEDGEATAVVKFQAAEQMSYKWFAIGTSDNPSLAYAYSTDIK